MTSATVGAFRDDRRHGILFAAVPATALVLLFLTRASEQTADSLAYALAARTGEGMFHPHHLLFTPLVRLSAFVLGVAWPSPDPILAGQVHNILWALVTLVAIQIIAREVLGTDAGAFLMALGVLMCRGFWLYATEIEAYIPSMGCLSLIAAILARRRERQLALRHHVLLACLLAMAVLYHQGSIIFCVPLAYYLMAGGRKDRRGLVLILSLAGVTVLTGYVVAFLFSDAQEHIAASLGVPAAPGLRGFLQFCLAYAYHPSPGWGTWRNLSVLGAGRVVHSQLRDIATFPWSLRFVAIPGFALSLALVFGWNGRRFLREPGREVMRGFLLIWLATYHTFYLWWFPGEKEFFIIPLVPLVLLVGLFVKDLIERRGPSPRRSIGLPVMALSVLCLLGASNAATTILPYHRSRGPAYQDAALLASRAPADCVAVVDYAVGQNLRYYFDRKGFIEAQMPLFYFYLDRTLPDAYRLEGSPCVIADLALISPAYSLGDLNAYDHPDEWLRYFRWVFSVDAEEKSASVTPESVEILGGGETGLYAWFRSNPRAAADLDPLFARLDEEWAARGEGGGKPFSSWRMRTGR